MKNLVLLTLSFPLFSFASPISSKPNKMGESIYCLNSEYNNYKSSLPDRMVTWGSVIKLDTPKSIGVVINTDYLMLVNVTDEGMEFTMANGEVVICELESMVPFEVFEEVVIESLIENGTPFEAYFGSRRYEEYDREDYGDEDEIYPDYKTDKEEYEIEHGLSNRPVSELDDDDSLMDDEEEYYDDREYEMMRYLIKEYEKRHSLNNRTYGEPQCNNNGKIRHRECDELHH